MVPERADYEKILKAVQLSNCLGQSKRQLRLFTYLLSMTENTKFLDVSQYDLAVEIFGRDETFDPTTDSIVRVEMHRLRSNLRKFSENSSEYTIEIPRASFQVKVRTKKKNMEKRRFSEFLKTPTVVAASVVIFISGYLSNYAMSLEDKRDETAKCSKNLPNLLVKNMGNESDLQLYHDQIIKSVLSQQTSINLIAEDLICNSKSAPAFVLEYLLLENSESFNFSLTLKTLKTNETISFRQLSDKVNAVKYGEDIYFDLVRTVNEISKPYGVIGRKSLTLNWGDRASMEGFKCLIVMYDSFSSENTEDTMEAHQCLEASSKHASAPLDLLGGLAASYIELGSQSATKIDPESLYASKAKSLFDHVGEDWINSAEMVIAKMAYETAYPDYSADSLRDIITVAKNRYETNPLVLLTASFYAGYVLGDWEDAKFLSDRIKRIHSDRDQSVFVLDAAYALIYEPADIAIETCIQAYSETSTMSNILLNACALEANDNDWIAKTGKILSNKNLSNFSEKIEYVKSGNFEPKLTTKLTSVFKASSLLPATSQ